MKYRAVQLSSLRPNAQKWYDRPVQRTFTIKIRKSTIVILLLIGYIIYAHFSSSKVLNYTVANPRIKLSRFVSEPKTTFKSFKTVSPVVEAVVASQPIPQPIAQTNCGTDPNLAFIYQHESGCSTSSINSIGCAGIGQACPGSKLPCSLSDWACQNAYFTNYAIQRYGSTYQAMLVWQSQGWW